MKRLTILVLAAVSVVMTAGRGFGFDPSESEADIRRDINRGEESVAGRLIQEERSVAHAAGQALKTEKKRDVAVLKGSKAAPDAAAETAAGADDSIEAIERDVDALERDAASKQ